MFYAAISGADIIGYREPLTAQTLTGAKRQAWRRFGAGYRHHTIHVGELLDAGTQYERGIAMATRDISGKRWRDLP
jgi:predicted secreted Zn-dependent protease